MREKILKKVKEKQKTLEEVRSHNKTQHPLTEDSKTYDRDFVPKENTRQKNNFFISMGNCCIHNSYYHFCFYIF
jgi:hypothetical protein